MADGGFGWSEGIALTAAALSSVISIISWRWAQASADAAKAANSFQLHIHQKEIFLAFVDLETHVNSSYMQIDRDKLIAFAEYKTTSYLYFPQELSNDLSRYHTLCWELSSLCSARIRKITEVDHCSDLAGAGNDKRILQQELQTVLDALDRKAIDCINFGHSLKAKLKDELNILNSTDKKSLWSRFLTAYNKPFDWDDKQEPK